MSSNESADVESKSTEITIETIKPKETVHQVKQRHTQEIKALSKGGGGKGKGSSKELKQREAQLSSEHAQELKEVQDKWALYREVESGKMSIDDYVRKTSPDAAKTEPTTELKLESGYSAVILSKSQQKQLAREKKEKEELARIQAELNNRPDPKAQELIDIERALAGFSFTEDSPYSGQRVVVKDIRPDGHCMYRAIADQLGHHTKRPTTFTDIRLLAAKEMRANPDAYLPYLIDADGSDLKPENFSVYVDRVEYDGSSGKLEVTWGGHPELVAISNALKRMIVVHQQLTAPLKFGEEFSGNGHPLHIVYQRYAYATGEHYNSVYVASAE